MKDVVAHLGALSWMVVDPSTLPDAGGAPSEEANEVHVPAHRPMTPAEVLADYESVSAKALAAHAVLVGQEAESPLGDLGTYPAAVLPAAFCFDHYLHIRADLFSPRGPLGDHAPPADAARLPRPWTGCKPPSPSSTGTASPSWAVRSRSRSPGRPPARSR